MATQTPKINLTKPALDENYSLDVNNSNLDKIDQAIGDLQANNSLPKSAITLRSNSFSGTAEILKSATASSDSGTIIRDIKPDGSMTQIELNNGALVLRKRTASGTWTATTIASL